MNENNTLLELNDIAKEYDEPEGLAAVQVLNGIDLTVQAGESLAIVGPSGSGKSTLLNIIGALDQPTRGRVTLNGRDLAGLSDVELASVRNREIGFVFQLHHLLPQCTVLENTLVPKLGQGEVTAEDTERAEALLERAGLSDRRSHRPGQLSGGELQRVAVVRALINQPGLLLADEPTGSLDKAAADNIARLLDEFNKEEGVAIILVTHSHQLAGAMSRAFELSDGTLQPTSLGRHDGQTEAGD